MALDPDHLGNAPSPLRWLAVLTAGQGLIMIGYALADLVIASVNGSDEWGAVWFAVVGLGLWGTGLLVCARGLLLGRRWAFTPVVFTSLMAGILSLSFFGAAGTVAKIAWGAVLLIAVAMLRLAFSQQVRDALINPRAED